MKTAVASGQGGTGQTTVATNLAVVAAELGRNVWRAPAASKRCAVLE